MSKIVFTCLSFFPFCLFQQNAFQTENVGERPDLPARSIDGGGDIWITDRSTDDIKPWLDFAMNTVSMM